MYKRQTLDSIINQSYQDWELVVLDNCSDDMTNEILKRYEYIENIKVIRERKKLSRTRALNTVYSKISNNSPFVMNMDADDKLDENWSQTAISFLEKNSDFGSVAGWAKIINEKSEEFAKFKALNKPGIINHLFSYTFPIVHSSTIFRRTYFLKKNGPYNEKIEIGQDWDLCIRLLEKCKFYFLDHPAVYWRRYESSITGKIENQLQSRIDKIKNINSGLKLSLIHI